MAVQITLYLNESDEYQRKPLYLAILNYLREQNVAGAVHQDRTEGVIAVAAGALRHRKGAAQECFVIMHGSFPNDRCGLLRAGGGPASSPLVLAHYLPRFICCAQMLGCSNGQTRTTCVR